VKKARGGEQPPPPVRSGLRKIALIGSAPSVMNTPWYDESWEIWSHASLADMWPRVDRSFEMHPDHVWRSPHKAHYLKWLKRATHPIHMLEQYPDIPSSRRFPLEQMRDECKAMIGREHIGSHTDYMIWQACREPNVAVIGLYGIHYIDPVKDGDRFDQLLAAKFWAGFACGRGIRLLIPTGNPMFDLPAEIYGCESHSTPEKYAARLKRERAVPRAKRTDGFGLGIEQLTPADGTQTHRRLPPIPGLGIKPMPENWEQFQ
jgi:hypothetical protein